MSTFNKAKFLTDLVHFTGSEYFYRAPMFKGLACSYTEGIKFLAQEARCYWLIDFIFSHQISKDLKNQAFQVWTITSKDGGAIIKISDGNNHHICDYKIPYSDFPLDQMTLWLVDNILLLPSEY